MPMTFEKLTQIVELTKPIGASAHSLAAPSSRQITLPDDSVLVKAKKAGVLVLLYPKNQQAHFVLTLRKEYKGVHSGQVSLPGGKAEPHDKSLKNTALREAQEEIGVNLQEVEIIKELSPVYIPPSNFLVNPYVAQAMAPPVFKKEDREVAEILEVPFLELLNNENYKNQKVNVRGFSMSVPTFVLKEKIVWGATAMILSELKQMVLTS